MRWRPRFSTSLCPTPSARFGKGVARDFRSRSISGRDAATMYIDAKNGACVLLVGGLASLFTRNLCCEYLPVCLLNPCWASHVQDLGFAVVHSCRLHLRPKCTDISSPPPKTHRAISLPYSSLERDFCRRSTSESANHSASCSTAYASVCPANWLEHIRESLKTLSLCCNTQAKNHVGTIPVPPRLGGAGTNLDSVIQAQPRLCVHLRGSEVRMLILIACVTADSHTA